MAGNANSGRHKDPATILKELNPIIDDAMPAVVAKMVDKAKAGDKDCMIRLFNHKFGLPRQEIDARIKQMFDFSPDDLALMRRVTTIEIAPAIDADVLELPAASEQTEALSNDQEPDKGDLDTD
jgi:hypothetical protein